MTEAHFRALAEHAPVGLFHVDLVGGWIYRNNMIVNLLGFKAFERLDEAVHHTDLLHPDDCQFYSDEYRRSSEQCLPLEIEVRYIRPDGSVTWMLEHSVPHTGADGKIYSRTGSVTDISARKQAEQRADRERQLILHISNGLGNVPSERFFDTLCEEMSAALHVDMASIRELVDTPVPHFRLLSGQLRGESIPPYCSLFDVADEAYRQSLRPRVIADLSQHSEITSRILFAEGMRALVSMPLRSSDQRLLGFMGVMHSSELDLELATRLLEIFSVRVASELERERSQRMLAEQRENLRWINELSVRIHDCTGVDAIGREAADALGSHSSAPRVSVAVLDGADELPLRIVARSWADTDGANAYPRLGDIFEALHANGGVMKSANTDNYSALRSKHREWQLQRGMIESILILLQHGGRELGLMSLQYTRPGAASSLDSESLHALGKMLSLAISNASHVADLEYRATHDPLTGLYSRNVLHQLFTSMVANAAGAFLLLLDLDRFKEVNDTLGHHIGDGLLRQIAARLQQHLIPEKSVLCRLGGDEFAILVPGDVCHDKHALTFGRELLTALQQPFLVNDVQLEIGASIGVALYPEHGNDSHELLRSADVAMYAAKTRQQGVALYDPKLDMHSPERLRLIADLGHGIRERELVLHYQPKLDLRSGQISGCEALVRWQHPRRGLLGPDHFIALAEMSDVIHELTAHVIEEACWQLSQWREQELNLSMAVNLSARNLIDGRIVDCIERVIDRFKLPRGALELEITETTLMHDPAQAAVLLERIAALGVRLSVDDFGTGYSSLAYLRRLPIHTLKIDRAFISEMHDKPQDGVIVQSIISLGHNLGLEVVAEGVEDRGALNTLVALGCDQVQGYYLSRPLPAPQVLAWMQEYKLKRGV